MPEEYRPKPGRDPKAEPKPGKTNANHRQGTKPQQKTQNKDLTETQLRSKHHKKPNPTKAKTNPGDAKQQQRKQIPQTPRNPLNTTKDQTKIAEIKANRAMKGTNLRRPKRQQATIRRRTRHSGSRTVPAQQLRKQTTKSRSRQKWNNKKDTAVTRRTTEKKSNR
ncbi:hypothetical protein G97194_004740 [Escherichia coli]|nr:hypothetical protein G97194_004740 [Escherichia coli]